MKEKSTWQRLLLIRMMKASMKFTEAFLMLIGKNQHRICKYKCFFWGDTQPLLTTNKKDK